MSWDEDDPFASVDNDRTVIRPSPGGSISGATAPGGSAVPGVSPAQNPGGRLVQGAGPAPRQPARPNSATQPGSFPDGVVSKLAGSGLNPLVDAATALLLLAPKLRNTVEQDNIGGLQEQIIRHIRNFEESARNSGCDRNIALTARYILCTFIDESVLKTPWGSNSHWAAQTLLSKFHKETSGGEKFFLVLDRLMQEPGKNLDLLELMYICLAMGFEGKYALSGQGGMQLSGIQDTVYRNIAMQRGEFEPELSPSWKGMTNQRVALVKYIPFWVVAVFAGVLLLVVYSGFHFVLDNSYEPLGTLIESVGKEQGIQKR